MIATQTRRRFLGNVALAGAACMLDGRNARADDAPLETTTVRFEKDASICVVPQDLAEAMLRTEGFTDVQYVEIPPYATGGDPMVPMISKGDIDFGLDFPALYLPEFEAGASRVTVLGGVHVGCFELFAQNSIRTIGELRGKTVGLPSAPPNLLALIAAHVGLDPAKDIHWIKDENALELFTAGKLDAFLGFPPEPQELRARKVGHVIVDTAHDKPWSQYFCCMLIGNKDYVRRYPTATKRVLRAVLKAADLCATDPPQAARQLVERGFTDRHDYAVQTIQELPFDKWREYDPEDTIRFYAVRLHEAGLIKRDPKKIIAAHTDWRLLKEVKRELKA
jgi:NitT/TauT family transport system substrate-binding protein